MEKENKKEKSLSRTFWCLLIGICIVFIVAISVGFFVFSKREDEVIDKTVKGGNVTLNYSNNINGLSIFNAVPTTNAIGMNSDDETQYLDFSVNVDLDEAKDIEYELSIRKVVSNCTISDDDIRIYLEKEKSGTYSKVFEPVKFKPIKEKTELGTKKGNMILATVKKEKTSKDNYRLRMWLADSSLVTNGNFSVEIDVVGKAK